MYDPAFEKERTDSNAMLRRCIAFLLPLFDGDKERAVEKLGKAIGYKSGNMIYRIMEDDRVLPGLLQGRRLVKAASERGFDDGANWFSADWKMSVGTRPHVLNGIVVDEGGEILKGAGMGLDRFEQRRPHEARWHFHRVKEAAERAIAECETRGFIPAMAQVELALAGGGR